jgi:serine protease Do
MARKWLPGLGALFLCLTVWPGPSAVLAAQEKEEENVVFAAAHGHGRLGLLLTEVTAKEVERLKLPAEQGALVTKVVAGSPAEKAGFAVDDVVVAYQGEPVHSVAGLVRMVRESPAGRKVAVDVLRKGVKESLSATLASTPERHMLFRHPGPEPDIELPNVAPPEFDEPGGMPPPPPPGLHMPECLRRMTGPLWHQPRRLGVEYLPISGQLAEYFGAGQNGILVSGVEPDGPAAKAGLKAGDVLLKVDGKDVSTELKLHQVLADVDAGQNLSLSVVRSGKPLEVKLKAGGDDDEMAEPAKTDVIKKRVLIRPRDTI